METSRENKITIVQGELTLIANTLYQLSVQVRVAEKVKDSAMKKTATDQMVKLETMKDEYELILKEVKEGK